MGPPGVQAPRVKAEEATPVRGWRWLVMTLFLCCLSGCQLRLTSNPPQARIEAALPSLLEQVAQVETFGPSKDANILRPEDAAFEPTAREALRIAMASCVRFYCTPDEGEILERMEAHSGIVLDFQSPQDVPTALPLSGWFGPLRGCEEMEEVKRLYLILEPGHWTEVIARSTDGSWSCWKSNWEIGG